MEDENETNKKIFEMSAVELLRAYEIAVMELTLIIHDLTITKRSIKAAYDWEQALKTEILKRLKGRIL